MSSCPASRCTSELYKLSLSSLSFRPSSRAWRSTGAAVVVSPVVLSRSACCVFLSCVSRLVIRFSISSGAELSREPGGFTAQDRIGFHDDRLGPRDAAGAHHDGIGPGDRARTADIAKRIFLILGPRGFLEVESGRPGVPEVPDVAVHALPPRAP